MTFWDGNPSTEPDPRDHGPKGRTDTEVARQMLAMCEAIRAEQIAMIRAQFERPEAG